MEGKAPDPRQKKTVLLILIDHFGIFIWAMEFA